MALGADSPRRLSHYSLVGEYAALAVQKGLADARWYATPVPKQKMRELLERRDGPAVRDTLIWVALLLAFGLAGLLLWGSGWALIPFALYGVIYASTSDLRWHESVHGTAFKTDWMNNTLYEIASFMVLRESVPWRLYYRTTARSWLANMLTSPSRRRCPSCSRPMRGLGTRASSTRC